MLNSVLLSVQRGRGANVFSEYTVELGETVEAAQRGDLGNGDICVYQQCLDIADSGHLNVVGDGKAGDEFETV